MYELRPYRPADRAAVYDICVRTADAGGDATGHHDDDALVPDVYAGPYLDYAPELATLVVDASGPSDRVLGYIVAVADTAAFVRWYRENWLPGFAVRHAAAASDARSAPILAAGLHPEGLLIAELGSFPAHLHINLLPETQGRGLGRALITTLLAQLHARGVAGVHLGYQPRNSGAAAFYARLGFRPLASGSPAEPRVGISTAGTPD